MKLGSQRGRTTGRHADFSENIFFLMIFELDNDIFFCLHRMGYLFVFPGGDAVMTYEATIIW